MVKFSNACFISFDFRKEKRKKNSSLELKLAFVYLRLGTENVLFQFLYRALCLEGE